MNSELKRLLDTLNEQYGEVRLSKVHKTEYVSIHKTKRKDVLFILVKTMESRGRDRSYFESPSMQESIAQFFLPDTSSEGMPKSQIKGGREVVKNELNNILAKVWPDPDVYSGPIPVSEPKEPETSAIAEKPIEPSFKPAGRDVNRKLYEKDANYAKPELDPFWSAITGVTKDE